MKHFFLFLVICIFTTTNLTAQERPIVVHENNRVASLQLSSYEYNQWISLNQFGDVLVRSTYLQDIYAKFQDDFDFVFFVLNEDAVPSGLPFGQFGNYSNQTEGIGRVLSDVSILAGSSGRLKGAIQLTARNFIRFGPTLHEILHNWGNFVIRGEIITENPQVNPSTNNGLGAHWGFTGGSSPGQLGGFDQNTLVVNDDGSFTMDVFGPNANGGNSVPYNDFELYLMGMIGVEEVADFDVFTNITSASFDEEAETFTFTADRETFTPETIVSSFGERVPSVEDSQKDFKALVVVITDEPLTATEFAIVDNDARNFETPGPDLLTTSLNFWEATRGIGTMEMGNIDQSRLSANDFAIEELVTIFPIPAQDKVNIKISEAEAVDTIVVYNTVGQLVEEFKYENTANDFTIDVSSYNSGLYFLHFKNGAQFLGAKRMIVNN